MIWLAVLLHIIGADTSTSRWYYFWSAFGSGPLAWCVLPFVYMRHHNCHTKGCWRMGHPDQHGTVKCRKHKPEPKAEVHLHAEVEQFLASLGGVHRMIADLHQEIAGYRHPDSPPEPDDRK